MVANITTAGNVTYLPFRFCTDVTPQCPVEHTIYGYYPSIGANAFFTIFFLMAAVLQLYAGIRYKTWTYLLAMFVGSLDQGIGYIGRLTLHANPFSTVGFQIQICCLILGPAFNSAAIYLVLKHITLCFGPEYSHIRPTLYTWIFITGDLVSLVIQAIGGGIAATSMANKHRQEIGDRLMMAAEAHIFLRSTKFRFFVLGFTIAFTAVFIRCVYRIVEMAGGWGNPIMQAEIPFIVLDGTMVAIATLMQTLFHPGWCFPRLSSAYVPLRPTSSASGARAAGSELHKLEK
ncbi:hypothetical protein LTR72_006020 [Exophiala xenobiotica]|nr:hypothetical protein LTR92_005951 [Exophiala xenobiotica]KAK5221765.1 hypothetical protein LTR72_006020 [Exophiala xenobiotica]KAK5294800.1 hypothetical protein LTR14_003968 [Exophiala xenobiotica]KAK5438549.1 hypothetical protein LTR18_008525 [Exophiala xenobiotica]KAK5483160.1 hypothetical protein LTR55_006560 [Exophiala xenobiotica]